MIFGLNVFPLSSVVCFALCFPVLPPERPVRVSVPRVDVSCSDTAFWCALLDAKSA